MRGRVRTYQEKLDRYVAKKAERANKRAARSAKTKAAREHRQCRSKAIKVVKRVAWDHFGVHIGEYRSTKFMSFLKDPASFRDSLSI